METIFKNVDEIKNAITNGVLRILGDVRFMCSFEVSADLEIHGDINACNIKVCNVKADNIKAWDINAGDINAGNINAGNIKAGDINAGYIKAWDINACDINAGGINARDISFFAICVAYKTLKCRAINGRRNNSICICLDSVVNASGDSAVTTDSETV